MKKVSIIIPVYNVAPYIEDCLRSVIRQAYDGEIECLLVDDCGQDKSMALASDLIEAYDGHVQFRILRHNRNMGLSAARNTGIRQASGDYVYFLDSDDEITPDCIRMLAAPLENAEYDFVIGGYSVAGMEHKVPKLSLPDGSSLYGKNIIKAYYERKWYMMACGKLCNLDFLRHNDLMMKEGLLHEDELWSFQLACLAKSMYVVNRESYIYKIREGSITMNSRTVEKKIIALEDIVRYMTDFILDNGIREEYASLKIFNTLNVLWKDTRNEPGGLQAAQRGRMELSRIPYLWRVRSCLTGLRKFIRNAYTLLPASFYGIYNRIIAGRR